MTCQELIEFLSDYLDGQLPVSQRLAFELHLSLCRDCRHYLSNYKTTIQASKQAFSQSAVAEPPPIPEKLVEAILKSRQGIRP